MTVSKGSDLRNLEVELKEEEDKRPENNKKALPSKEVQQMVRDLILELTSSPELKLRKEGKAQYKFIIQATNQCALIPPSTETAGSNLLHFPTAVFVDRHEDLRLARLLLARYQIRLLNWDKIYPEQSRAVVSALIFLDFFQDFFPESADLLTPEEQKARVRVFTFLNSYLPPHQRELVARIQENLGSGELMKENAKKLIHFLGTRVDPALFEELLGLSVKQDLMQAQQENNAEIFRRVDPAILAHPGFNEKVDEIYRIWCDRQLSDKVLEGYFAFEKPLTPYQQLKELSQKSISDLSPALDGFLKELKKVPAEIRKLEPEDPEIKKQALRDLKLKILLQAENLINGLTLRRENFSNLRILIFQAINEVFIVNNRELKKKYPHQNFQTWIHDLIEVEKPLPVHLIEGWAEMSLGEVKTRIEDMKTIPDSDDRQKYGAFIRQLLMEINATLRDIKKSPTPFHPWVVEPFADLNEKIKEAEQSCESQDKVRQQEFEKRVLQPIQATIQQKESILPELLLEFSENTYPATVIKIFEEEGMEGQKPDRISFTPQQFYQALKLAGSVYGLIPFCETPLALALSQKKIKLGQVILKFDEAFEKPFKKLNRPREVVPLVELNLSSVKEVEKLFDLYANLLMYERTTEVIPFYKEKVETQLKGCFADAPVVQDLFLKGVLACLNREKAVDYKEAAKNFKEWMERTIKLFDEEEKNLKEQIQRERLTGESRHQVFTQFYRSKALLRLRYKSALLLLKHIVEINQNSNAFAGEHLPSVVVQELADFLEDEELKNFLRKKLPSVRTMAVGIGERKRKQDVWVFDFLDEGGGGKEGHNLKFRYAFFNKTWFYDWMGYYKVVVPDESYSSYKTYVSKIALKEPIVEVYRRVFGSKSQIPDVYPLFDTDMDRLLDNDIKEQLVHDFMKAFKEFLAEAAKLKEETRDLDTAMEIREYLKLLIVPGVITGEVGENGNSVPLLLTEFVEGLDGSAPRLRYEDDKDKDNILKINVEEDAKARNWIKNLKNKLAHGQYDLDEDEKKEADSQFNRIKAMIVVINTFFRNLDLNIFFAENKNEDIQIVFMDMEAILPHFFGPLFQESEVLSYKYTMRLKNPLVFKEDDPKLYQDFLYWLVTFLQCCQQADLWECRVFAQDQAGKNEALKNLILAYAKGNTLRDEVELFVKNDGDVRVNRDGRLEDRMEREAKILAGKKRQTGQIPKKVEEPKRRRLHRAALPPSAPPRAKEPSAVFTPEEDIAGSVDQLFDAIESNSELEESGDNERKKSDRLRFIAETELIRVRVPSLIKSQLVEKIVGGDKVSKLLFGETYDAVDGKHFVITAVEDEKKSEQENREFIRAMVSQGQTYLGRLFIRENIAGEDLSPRKAELEKESLLPQAQEREHFIVLVCRPIGENNPVIKPFGVASMGYTLYDTIPPRCTDVKLSLISPAELGELQQRKASSSDSRLVEVSL